MLEFPCILQSEQYRKLICKALFIDVSLFYLHYDFVYIYTMNVIEESTQLCLTLVLILKNLSPPTSLIFLGAFNHS